MTPLADPEKLREMPADLLARIAKALADDDGYDDASLARAARTLLPECAEALRIAVEALRAIEAMGSPGVEALAREALSRLTVAAEGKAETITVSNTGERPPSCLTCDTPMVFCMWERPGGPPGNGYRCPKCHPFGQPSGEGK